MLGNNLEQSQRQILSHNMIQSVEILQMNSQELDGYIKELALENPLVELSENRPESKEEDRLKKLEWLSRLDEQNRTYYKYDREDSENTGFLDNVGGRRAESLAEVLHLQLLGKGYSDEEMEAFDFIAQSLDERGFYTAPVSELAEHFHIEEKQAQGYLEIMRGLEPTGVCAASLQECLLTQLEKAFAEEDCVIEKEIVQNCLTQLGKNQLPAIADRLDVSLERVVEARDRIRELNPIPAQGFDTGDVFHYVTPDITIVRFEGQFEILLNDYSYPTIHVNKYYLSLLKTEKDKEVHKYLDEKFKQLEQAQSFISKRGSTLLRLARCILDAQREFFLYGPEELRPYRMKDAAERMEVHESTVSRAVKDKYLQCSWGVFPLSYFFSGAIGGGSPVGRKRRSPAEGGTDGAAESGAGSSGSGIAAAEQSAGVAVTRVKGEIRRLIENENKKKPYSDQKLTDLLTGQGFDISRRTVAKYREEMGIGNGRERKQY